MKPKVLLIIDHRGFLLPDDTGAAAILKTLSRAIPVYDCLYDGKLQLRGDAVDASMKYVTQPFTLVDEHNNPVQTKPARGLKSLPSTVKSLEYRQP